MHVHFL
jgi:hypothetical protein